MPTPTDFTRYNATLVDLTMSDIPRGGLLIPCATRSDAMNLRLQFYGFRRALERAGPGQAELLRRANLLRLTLEGTNLRISNVDDNPAWDALSSALRAARPPVDHSQPATPVEPPRKTMNVYETVFAKYLADKASDSPVEEDKPTENK